MEKPFLEVFPGLNIADELKELLKLVVVEKVTMTRTEALFVFISGVPG